MLGHLKQVSFIVKASSRRVELLLDNFLWAIVLDPCQKFQPLVQQPMVFVLRTHGFCMEDSPGIIVRMLLTQWTLAIM